MITTATLFILGAGASKPYGFPTGRELRKYIFSEFPSDYEKILREYMETNKGKSFHRFSDAINEARIFAESFKNSSIPSIDQYIALSPNFKEIGKTAITTAILKFEKQSRFREDISEPLKDWYRLLYERMIEGFYSNDSYTNFRYNQIAFITFNYDRSLEHFLYESLLESFFEKKDEIAHSANILMPFQFIHIYGCVDKPEWSGGFLNID